jgi:phosphate-selective porin OprO/OprP
MKIRFYTLVTALMFLGITSKAQNEDPEKSMNQYGKEVDETIDLQVQARDGIITFESKDKNYKFWMDNRLYFDGGIFFDKDAYNPIGNGLTVRRARIAVKANLYHNWYGEVDLDFANSVVELKDVYVKYSNDADNFNIKAGHFKEGFSMETTTTSRYLTFMERSLVSKFAPSRHLGVQTNYISDRVLLTGGIHFNTIGESEEVVFSQNANKDFGKDEGYSLTGRVVFRPLLAENKFIHIGTAASYRTPKTTAEVPDSYRFSTRSISTINRKKYLDTDDIINVKSNVLWNVEVAGASKNLMFQAEYISDFIKRKNDSDPNVSLNGFYAQAGILLNGAKYNYNRNEGEFTQISRRDGKGALEFDVRFDYIDLNDEEALVFGGGANAYTLGLNYHFNSNVKFMLNYSYLNHDRYANGKGKLYVGHDVDGNLTKDYTKVVESDGEAGDDFGQLQMRIEIDF